MRRPFEHGVSVAVRVVGLTAALIAPASFGCGYEIEELDSYADFVGTMAVDGGAPQTTDGSTPQGADGGEACAPGQVARGWEPSSCHDLAPACGVNEILLFRGSCPLSAAPRGGQLRDGVYRLVQSQICQYRSAKLAGVFVRIRISGEGTHLDWSADRPLFSAAIRTVGNTLHFDESCHEARAARTYQKGFTVAGDELTFYDGPTVMVFRREP
jgi:hypothetical protein